MKARPALILTALGAAALVLAFQGGKALFINGKKSAKAPIVKGSETYIPLSSLKAAGAGVTVEGNKISIQFTPMAGRNERDYVEGALGEYVSNEAWRVKATNVAEIANPFTGNGKGFSVDLEVRNLLKSTQTMHGSGLDGIRLIDAAGNGLDAVASSFPGRNQRLEPGGSLTNTLKFGPSGPGVEVKDPAKIVITFRPFGKPKAYKAIRINLVPAE